MKTALIASSLFGVAFSMNAPEFCYDVDVGDGTACIYQRGNAFQHWFETEDGYALCRTFENGEEKFSYASGVGTEAGLECSTIPLSSRAARPANIPRFIRPVPHADEDAGSEEVTTLVDKVRAARAEGRRLLQGNVLKLKNLVLLLRWKDDVGLPLPDASVYQKILSAPGGDPEYAPTGSVADVFESQFNGRIKVETTVVGWVDMPYTHAEAAGPTKSDGTTCGGTCFGAKLRDAIYEALAKVDGTLVNLGDFDLDGDKSIDMFTVIHSGYGAETLAGKEAGSKWIWSHKYQLTRTYRTKQNSVRILAYNINPGRWGTEDYKPTRIGVIAHESMHFLGLPDLYDADYSSRGISNYGMMANSWGVDRSQQYPPSLSPWSKFELGVVDPFEINEDKIYELPAVQSGAVGTVGILKMKYGNTNYNDYILVEYRAKQGYDQLLPGGILIWHIDPSKSSNRDESYPGGPGWPSRHYKVRVIQADGLFNLEQPLESENSNRGDDGDWFYQGGAGPGEISDLTEPSLKGYSLITSSTRCTGHRLKNFGPRGGASMTFEYQRMKQDCSGVPENQQPPTPPPVVPGTPTSKPTQAPVATTIPWDKVCNPNYYNKRDGCDCGCGTVRDPDCTAGGSQADRVYCDGATTVTPGATCDLTTNKCVQRSGALDGEKGMSKEEFAALDAQATESNSMIIPIAAGAAGVAFLAAATAFYIHRKKNVASTNAQTVPTAGVITASSNPMFEP